MVCVCENEENILQDGDEKLLEECVGGASISFGNVCDQLETHVKSSKLYFSVVVLACPHARVNHKLELSVIEFEEGFQLLAEILLEEQV